MSHLKWLWWCCLSTAELFNEVSDDDKTEDDDDDGRAEGLEALLVPSSSSSWRASRQCELEYCTERQSSHTSLLFYEIYSVRLVLV